MTSPTTAQIGTIIGTPTTKSGPDTYRISATDEDGNTAVLTITIAVSERNRGYDVDGDHLIEVGNESQLNAIRWDLDGDGVPIGSAVVSYHEAFPDGRADMGCRDGRCLGYELSSDVSPRSGWNPIGNRNNSFNATFQGNGLRYQEPCDQPFGRQ